MARVQGTTKGIPNSPAENIGQYLSMIIDEQSVL